MRLPTFVLLLVACLLSGIQCLAPGEIHADPTSAEQQTARKLLAERDLRKAGGRWITTADFSLRTELDSLDWWIREIREARKQIQQLVERNDRLRVEVQKTVTALRQAQASASGTTPTSREKIKSLNARLSKLRGEYLPPLVFCEHPSARQAAVRLTTARSRLSVLAYTAPARIYRIQGNYTVLDSDPQITGAIKTLGGGQKIGDGKALSRYRQRLSRAESLVLTDTLPLYRENGRLRFGALVNETTAATFSYHRGSGPTLVPDSVIRKAGISIRPKADRIDYRTADGRMLSVRLVQVSYMRLGGHLLESVPVYVLPPEGEDLGGVITDETLTGYSILLDPARLELKLRRTAE